MHGEDGEVGAGPVIKSASIGSVGTALQVLSMLGETPTLRVSDVAATLGIARSGAHRILTDLQRFGFLDQDAHTRVYRQGPALDEVGLAAVGGSKLRRVAHEHLRELRDATGETVELCLIDGNDMVVADVAEGSRALRVVDSVGDRMTLHLTAAGKAVLAARQNNSSADPLSDEATVLATGNDASELADFGKHLDAVRQLGYATNMGGPGIDSVGVAAAVVDGAGSVRGAISLVLPWTRAGDGFAERLGPMVKRTAESIGCLLRD